MVYATDLKSVGLNNLEGSSPSSPTNDRTDQKVGFFVVLRNEPKFWLMRDLNDGVQWTPAAQSPKGWLANVKSLLGVATKNRSFDRFFVFE